MTRLAVYYRVSTDAQDTDSQRQAVSEWLARRPAGDAITVYEDCGSGKSDARPAYQKLCDDIAAKRVDAVVVYRLDRLSRNAASAMRLLIDWMQQGVEFWAVDQPILQLGKDNPFRLTFAALMAEIAEIERQTIVTRVRAGLAAARARGVQLGGKPKLTADQILAARAMRAERISYKDIGARLGVAASTVHKTLRSN